MAERHYNGLAKRLPFFCAAAIIRRMAAAPLRIVRHPAFIYGGLLLACALVVSPRAEFPLNDDWLYAKMAQNTLDARAYVAHPFVAANATLHAIWGALVIAVFGFSYTALRVSTFVVTFLAVWLTCRGAREAGATKPTAFLAGLVVFVNPIVVNLTYTYMSDMMFLAMLAGATWGYLRALRTGRSSDLAIGSAFSAAAMLVRQMGVLPPAVFVIAWTLTFVRAKRLPNLTQAAGFAVPLVVGVVLYEWGQYTSGGIYTWPNAWENAPIPIIVLQVGRYIFASCIYFGLFLLPCTLAYAVWLVRHRHAWTWMRTYWSGLLLIWLLMFGCGFLLMRRPAPMPLLTNILRNFGVGPLTLHDTTHLYPGWGPVRLSPAFWWAVTAVAMLSATVLIVEFAVRLVIPSLKPPGKIDRPAVNIRNAQHLFLIGSATAHLLALQNPWITVLFDRYLLPSFAPLAILGAVLLTRIRARHVLPAAAIVCAPYFAFSLVALQDYFAWNRARWEAVEILRTEYGAADDQIEGGYEFNGAFTSDRYMDVNETADFLEFGPYGWWTFDPQYAISFLPREGYEWVRDVPYFSWLGMEERQLNILQRVTK